MKDATSAAQADEYAKQIENVARDAGIPLSNFEIDKEKFAELFEGLDIEEVQVDVKPTVLGSAEEISKNISEPLFGKDSELVKNVDTWDSGLQKIKDGWDENTEAADKYLETLMDADINDLMNIRMNDKAIDSKEMEKYENALDGISNLFGLTREEAENMVPLLQAIGALTTDISEAAEVTSKVDLKKLGETEIVKGTTGGIESADVFDKDQGQVLHTYIGQDAVQQAQNYQESLGAIQDKMEEGGQLASDLSTKLSQYSAEELKNINYTDGAYDETNQRAKEAEQTVDSLMQSM